MKKYTVGIIFNKDLDHVLLALKNRPDWMKGTYNGPGGRFEDVDQDCFDCVVREIQEECGLETHRDQWDFRGYLESISLSVDFLTMIYQGEMDDMKTLTDEVMYWIPMDKLPKNLARNIDWIIPLCYRFHKGDNDLNKFIGYIE